MPSPKPKTRQALDRVRKVGVLHTHDLKPLGIPQEYLGCLCAKGLRALDVVEEQVVTVEIDRLALALAWIT
jgi:hypothetical protein